jgi:prepilin-type N-terminal cleavage/methylation domain-containing protein
MSQEGLVMMDRKGFTLIELLIVVVIIGILAAIAIPKFATTKEKAYIAAMKSDLKNLITSEEAYFADNMAYTATVASLSFSSTAGVGTPTVTIASDGNGFTATVTHSSTSVSCVVYTGTDATTAGEPDGAAVCS